MCVQGGNPGGGIHDHPRPSGALAFGSGISQASLNALDYQAAFEFGQRTQDGEDHLAGRTQIASSCINPRHIVQAETRGPLKCKFCERIKLKS